MSSFVGRDLAELLARDVELELQSAGPGAGKITSVRLAAEAIQVHPVQYATVRRCVLTTL